MTSQGSLNLETFIPMVQPITIQMEVKCFPKMKRTEIRRKISANRNTGKTRIEEN